MSIKIIIGLRLIIALAIPPLLALVGCEKAEPEAPTTSVGAPPLTLGAPLQPLTDEQKQALIPRRAVEVLNTVNRFNPRELDAILPETIGDFKRSDAKSEKKERDAYVSEVSADYTGDRLASIHINIRAEGANGVDIVSQLEPALTWHEIDQETETGYYRSTTIGGCKAYERYDNKEREGYIEVFITRKLTVVVSGKGVSMADIKRAFGRIDVEKLRSLQLVEEIDGH